MNPFSRCFNNSHLSDKWLLLFSVLTLLFVFQNCTADRDSDEILATVNENSISISDFEQKYVQHLIRTGRNDTKGERYKYLNELIDNLAVADAALDGGYISNKTYKDAIWFQERKSLADIYFVDQMNLRLEAPEEEEIRLAFAKSKRKVYVRHLYSKDEEKLNTYYDRLEAGEDFIELANEFYNTNVYDSTAGYLGPISYYGIDDNFAETAFSINEGEFSRPIRTSYGFHIIFVEKILFEALLTESEYQVRREGIESKVKQRKQALVANQYIRDLMGSLDVEMNRDALITVMEKIRNLPSVTGIEQEQNNNSVENVRWSESNLNELALELDNESVLGTYVLLGERINFTVQDYFNWLPYLPLDESRNRTGASVGRAMRNEVFMRLAMDEGYESDLRVRKEVKDRGMEVLSRLYQQDLISEALDDPKKVVVPNDFRNQVIRNRKYQIETTYWKIPTSSIDEANLIRSEILNGGIPQSYPNYRESENITLNLRDADYSLISEASVNTPVVARSASEGWMVLFVSDRELIELEITEDDPEIEKMYKVIDYLSTKIDSIRSGSTINVDTALFDKIYDL